MAGITYNQVHNVQFSNSILLQPSPSIEGCSAVLSGESGTITSPDYPNSYPSNADCTWEIIVKPSKIILIEFKDMDIEDDSKCSYDKLLVQEKYGRKFKTTAKFCGSVMPNAFRTQSNLVKIIFRSDESENRRGFKLNWKAISEEIEKCGKTLFNTTIGSLHSPGFPISYPNNLNCSYQIRVPQGHKVEITMQSLDIEYRAGCQYDVMKIYDVGRPATNLLGSFCGNKIPQENVVSRSQTVMINFKTDGSTTGQGFNLTWIAKPTEESTSNQTCGRKFHSTRIVGGTFASRGEFPWQAAFFWRVGIAKGKYFCGGALIDQQWILTAAHCFVNGRNETFYKVMLGDHNIHSQEGHEQVFNISSIIIHPGYNMITHDNDIALVKLEKNPLLNDFVNTLCLPTQGPQVGTRCQIAGWGATMEHGRASDILMKAEVPLIGKEVCSHRDVYGPKITDNMMCAGYARGGIDTCQGDSGGPLHCQSKEDPGSWEIQGVASWGRGCGRQMKYGVYTVVGNYLEWIQCKMEARINCTVSSLQSEVRVKTKAATATKISPTMSLLFTRSHFEIYTKTRSPKHESTYTTSQMLPTVINPSREPFTLSAPFEPSVKTVIAYSNEHHEIISSLTSSVLSQVKTSMHNLPCRTTVMLRSRILVSNELQTIVSSGSLDTNIPTQQTTDSSGTVQMTSMRRPISTYRILETTQFTSVNNLSTTLWDYSTAAQIQKSRPPNLTMAGNKQLTPSYLPRTQLYFRTDYLTQKSTVESTNASKSELLSKTSANSATVGVLATLDTNLSSKTLSFSLDATSFAANASQMNTHPTIGSHHATLSALSEASSALFVSIAPSVSRDHEKATQITSKNTKSIGNNLMPAQFQTILIPSIILHILLEYLTSDTTWV
eukprot:Seg1946.5 transcript_id=Seg1946.5/GoldUCD/mRNA.D3Y31 product="Mannan-binding lectin serine protease 1" protein_id=Seg1946.5/GoldUCD/D3Y31